MKRHAPAIRIWHWINAAALLVMLMSGLMIFNAHLRLPWGQGWSPIDKWQGPQLASILRAAGLSSRAEARERIDNLGLGKGDYWDDRGDYAWYAGI